jgi:hypothetical protein
MSSGLQCYRCGGSLVELSLPLRRLEECPACGAELHVCRMCTHYAPRLAEACDEDAAPDVRDKKRANFCDFFTPNPEAYVPASHEAERAAEERLTALFGDEPAGTAGARGQSDGEPGNEAIERAKALFED